MEEKKTRLIGRFCFVGLFGAWVWLSFHAPICQCRGSVANSSLSATRCDCSGHIWHTTQNRITRHIQYYITKAKHKQFRSIIWDIFCLTFRLAWQVAARTSLSCFLQCASSLVWQKCVLSWHALWWWGCSRLFLGRPFSELWAPFCSSRRNHTTSHVIAVIKALFFQHRALRTLLIAHLLINHITLVS